MRRRYSFIRLTTTAGIKRYGGSQRTDNEGRWDRMRNFSEKISRKTAIIIPKEWMLSIRTDCKVRSRLELAQVYDHLQIFW